MRDIKWVNHVEACVPASSKVSNTMASHFKVIFFLLMLISLCFARSVYADTSTVNCQGVDDTSAVQDALNSAAPGDTIELVGTCQLNGTPLVISKSNLNIEGVGAVGNWSSVLSGCTVNGCYPSATGKPARDYGNPSYAYHNRAFVLASSISNVSFQGIKFQNLYRGITLQPQDSALSVNCNDIAITSGSASNISISNNWFNNTNRAITAIGSINQANVSNNLITNSLYKDEDMLFEGQAVACFNSDGSLSVIGGLGLPSSITIENNTINQDQSAFPIYAYILDSVKILRNSVTASDIGNIVVSAKQATVSQNVVDGGGVAYEGIFDALDYGSPLSSINNTISNNKVMNVPYVAIGVDSNVFGVSIINNQFDTSSAVDVLLCDANGSTDISSIICDANGVPSSNNIVMTNNFSTSVMDLGLNNKLVGTLNLLNNVNVPASTKTNLINNVRGKPLLP